MSEHIVSEALNLIAYIGDGNRGVDDPTRYVIRKEYMMYYHKITTVFCVACSP